MKMNSENTKSEWKTVDNNTVGQTKSEVAMKKIGQQNNVSDHKGRTC